MTAVVPGKRLFKEDFAHMVLLSAAYFPALFGARVGRALAELYIREGNLFSYRHTLFALHESTVAGMILAYDYTVKRKESLRTGVLLFAQCGPQMLKSLPVLLRLDKTIGSLPPGACYISNIATYKNYRGQGIASRLIAACEERGRQQQATQMVLDVEQDNLTAVSLYKYLGYTEAAEFRITLGPSCLAFIRMSKSLA